jgi:hypothetical protein
MSTTPDPAEDFDAGKAIFEKLKDIPQERQEKILRWVCENLGISTRVTTTQSADEESSNDDDEESTAETATGTERPVDIKSFVQSKSPKSDQQFAAVAAYYYRFAAPQHEQKEAITAKVLQDAARFAGRAVLNNPKATLNNARQSGYLDRSGRGEFRITTVGENLVTMTLPRGEKQGAKKRGAARKRATAKKRAANKRS